MDNEEENTTDNTCQILQLPQCVLRVLFSYLDSTALYQLTRTCHYFQCFVTDSIFWRYIDARRNPNTTDKVQYCSDRIHEKTTHVFLKAKDKTSGLVPYDFFTTINPYKNIRVLALENQRFNGFRLTLKDFPSGLEELSLKGTHIKSSTYFFQHSGQTMHKLRVLILDQCQWVTCSFLMSVAKYESLEIVSAIQCLRLHLNMVPYLNVARYGCKKLKVFDCRFTRIGHELLRSFYPKESLQSLYFQGFKSGEIDYKGLATNQWHARAELTTGQGSNVICDESLFEYINSSACDIIDKMPESVLYKDPYPECTCNHNNKDDSHFPSSIDYEEYYVYIPSSRKSIKFVCQRHVQDVEKLSDHFREFFLTNQHQFYAAMNASEVESEPDSSDSDPDDNCGTCCMYGMGRSMILLTPGNNPGSIQEEVLELNPVEQEQGGRVVSIFISTPLRECANNDSNNANPTPSTSRTVQVISGDAIPGHSRRVLKRKHGGDKDQDKTKGSKSKRAKRNKDLERSSDEAKTAEVSEFIESTNEMGKNVNEFVRSSMEMCNKSRSSTQEKGPSTSSVRDMEVQDNVSIDMQESQNNVNVNRPSKKVLARNDSNEASTSSDRREFHNGEPSRRPIVIGAPRTAIITIRNRERSRYVNPLFVQIENKHLTRKSRLRRLSLRGFRKITNVSLEYIKNLKLELLDLTYTSVTKEGIENFLSYNPNCRIVHPLYCICKPLTPF